MIQPNRVVVHEAGHALVARLFGFPVHEIRIFPEHNCGYVRWGKTGDQCTVEGQLVCCAGAAAEISVFGKIVSSVEELYGNSDLPGDILLGGFPSWQAFEQSAHRCAKLIDPSRLKAEMDCMERGNEEHYGF